MAWSVLQSASTSLASSGTSVAVTLGTNVSSGTKLICYLAGRIGSTAAITSVVDNNSNAFTLLPGHIDQGQGNQNVCILVLDTPSGDVGTKPTITATWNSGAHFEAILVQEVSGLIAGTSPLDGSSGTSFGTSSGTIGPPSYTSTASNEYLVYVYGDIGGATWTAPGGYTADANSINANANASIAIAYKNSTNGTETGTWSLSASTEWGLILTAFKLSAVSAVSGTVQPLATFPTPRRKPGRAVTGFVPVVTVNTGHGPAGTVQPLAASLVAPRRRPSRAVVRFIPVATTNAPAKPHPAHGTPASDEARGWKRWLLWGP